MALLDLLCNFNGRISRSTFWWAMVGSNLAGVAVAAVAVWTQALVLLIFVLPLVWPMEAIYAKRWHDRNKSAWWSLIAFVPIIGGIAMLIELGFLSGTRGPNKYGPQP